MLWWIWLAVASALSAQSTPEDTLERVRAARAQDERSLEMAMCELACLLRIGEDEEALVVGRACLARLAPGELREALAAFVGGRLRPEAHLPLARNLMERGRIELALPLLLGLASEAPRDLRTGIALAEALASEPPRGSSGGLALRDREAALHHFEDVLDQVARPHALRALEAEPVTERARLEARVREVARGRFVPRPPAGLHQHRDLTERLVLARSRGDHAMLVDAVQALARRLGRHPALEYLLGAACASAGPACNVAEARARLSAFLVATDFDGLAARDLVPEFTPDEVAAGLRELCGIELPQARGEAQRALAELTATRGREPLLLIPDRRALGPLIEECDRRIAELAGLRAERARHDKELARWRKALAKDLAARGIGGQSADTIRDHIHVHVTAIAKLDKRLAAEAADPQLPKLRARRSALARILAGYDTKR